VTSQESRLRALLRPTQMRLVRVLEASSAPLSGREFARRLNVSPTSAIRSLHLLEKAGVVTRHQEGKAHLWRLNRENVVISGWLAEVAAGRRRRLIGLMAEECWKSGRRALLCARDVCDEIALALPVRPGSPFAPWMPGASVFVGIDVTVIDAYEPGRWKLVLHDGCEVIGGSTPGEAMIVTHRRCAVLADSAEEAPDPESLLCDRCKLLPGILQVRMICGDCDDVKLCQPCYELHAREKFDEGREQDAPLEGAALARFRTAKAVVERLAVQEMTVGPPPSVAEFVKEA
jgi:DNA-binding transcriptional ArsR family regulator